MIKEMTPREFLDRRAAGDDMTLLDVREDWEIDAGAGAHRHRAHPHGPDRRSTRPNSTRKQETVVICRSGGRSAQVARFSAAPGLWLGFQPLRRNFGLVPGLGP